VFLLLFLLPLLLPLLVEKLKTGREGASLKVSMRGCEVRVFHSIRLILRPVWTRNSENGFAGVFSSALGNLRYLILIF
jgi:hypothetical protein